MAVSTLEGAVDSPRPGRVETEAELKAELKAVRAALGALAGLPDSEGFTAGFADLTEARAFASAALARGVSYRDWRRERERYEALVRQSQREHLARGKALDTWRPPA